MPRPEFITNEIINKYSSTLDSDSSLPNHMVSSPIIREVCYAGLYLQEELSKLSCIDPILTQVLWTAGKLSYGRDPWDIHLQILEDYKNNKLIFEIDPIEQLN